MEGQPTRPGRHRGEGQSRCGDTGNGAMSISFVSSAENEDEQPNIPILKTVNSLRLLENATNSFTADENFAPNEKNMLV